MVRSGLEISQKHELWGLIKRLGAIYGETDANWLAEYGRNVYDAQKLTLGGAILCFQDLVKQGEFLDIENKRLRRLNAPLAPKVLEKYLERSWRR
jgi:hypothetical protein